VSLPPGEDETTRDRSLVVVRDRAIHVELNDGSVDEHDSAVSFSIDAHGLFVYGERHTIAFYPHGQFISVRTEVTA
jgi:hypothetical protein